MTINEAINSATEILKEAGIENPRHEAQLLLSSDTLRFMFMNLAPGKDMDDVPVPTLEYILAHPEKKLPPEITRTFHEMVGRRALREPFAYIVEEKEFYGREFYVTPDVLIPRPETETLIDVTKNLARKNSRILDVGTGSGAIAVTLAEELPNAQIFASDKSAEALDIATRNASTLSDKDSFNIEAFVNYRKKSYPAKYSGIEFIESDLLKDIDGEFDLIVANLPYVDREWRAEESSPEILHEPEIALFADDGGMKLINELIHQAPRNLENNGSLILEMDPVQMDQVSTFAKKFGFSETLRQDYALVLQLTAK